MKAMKRLNKKFGVFAAHLKNFISDTLKKCDCATLQGKYNNLTQVSLLLRRVFLSDILQYTRKLSLAEQSEDIDIISLLEQIDNENFYQSTKERGIAQEKEYLENNVLVVIHKIVTGFEE